MGLTGSQVRREAVGIDTEEGVVFPDSTAVAHTWPRKDVALNPWQIAAPATLNPAIR